MIRGKDTKLGLPVVKDFGEFAVNKVRIGVRWEAGLDWFDVEEFGGVRGLRREKGSGDAGRN